MLFSWAKGRRTTLIQGLYADIVGLYFARIAAVDTPKLSPSILPVISGIRILP